MWPLLLAIAFVITGPGDVDMLCPGLEMTHLRPQCINDKDLILDSNNKVVCPQNSTWEPYSTVCNMCGGCTTYVSEECNPGDKCKPGYECAGETCSANSSSCQYVADNNTHISWKPRCNGADYEPVQCKGDRPTGRCFCFDKKGNRIFGEQLWAEAENMTCACSRRVQELQDQGRKDVTLHCNEQGNYEELQCDNGVCWCAEEKTGTPISRILPENMMTMLPCYENASLGSGYLRQCESMLIAQKRIEILMAAHSSTNPNFPYTNCEFDGSYGALQQDGNQLFCAWKDKSRIESYASQLSGMRVMNCKCARDKKKYGDAVQFECEGNGNYVREQYTNDGTKYCVDPDGFRDGSCDEI